MRRSNALACLFVVGVSAPARAGYLGDMPLGPYDNSGATVWSGDHAYTTLANPAGASILNQGSASAEIVDNAGVIRNAPGASWNGDLDFGANRPGAEVVNQGDWRGALANAGGQIDNSGSAGSVANAAGGFANEGTVSGSLANDGQASNNGTIGTGVVNHSIFVNNATGSVQGGLIDSGATTNNGAIAGGVSERGGFVNNASGLVSGGFALVGGSAVNNGEIDGGASAKAGGFTNNGLVKGDLAISGAAASFTDNGVVSGGATVTAGSLVVNATGIVEGDVANAGALQNAGAIRGDVENSGSFVNSGGGSVEGLVRQSGGQTTNNGALDGGAQFLGGAAVNNGAIAGPVVVGPQVSLVDNGVIAGGVSNAGGFVVNGAGVVRGGLDNSGLATINGVVQGGARNSGALVVNASGRIDGGLINDGGSTANAGVVTGGATVTSGLMTNTGVIEGGLSDAGLVRANGTISGPIVVTGALVVGNGAPDGARLTIAPGSSVTGTITVPVDLASGKSDFVAAQGASLAGARLGLTGTLANPRGAYWARLSLSDTPLALTSEAKAALASASGPLYAYAAPDGATLVQTINPGLGATALQIAAAAATAFAEAMPAPSPTRAAGVSVWSRGFGAALSLSGENAAGAGPAFDATRLSTRLGGGALGLDYGVDVANFRLHAGLMGGGAFASVTDRAGSGASGAVTMPFAGAYAMLTGRGLTATVAARAIGLDMRLNDAPLAVFNQSQRAAGVNVSGDVAYAIPLGAVFVEPSAGVSWTRLTVADQTTNVGALSFGRAQLALAHAGLRLGAEFAAGGMAWRPYLLGAVWREGRRGANIAIPDGPTITPTGLGGFEQVGLGVSATLHGFSAYAEAEAVFGARLSGVSAKGGVRLAF